MLSFKQFGDDPLSYFSTDPTVEGIWVVDGRLLIREDVESPPMIVGDASTWSSDCITAFYPEPGTLFAYRGLPGSGKSTEANQLHESLEDCVHVSMNHFYDGGPAGQANMKFRETLDRVLWEGHKFVVADNLNPRNSDLSTLQAMASRYNYKIVVMCPNTSWRESPQECASKASAGTSPGFVMSVSKTWEY